MRLHWLVWVALGSSWAEEPASEDLMRAGRLMDAWPVARAEAQAGSIDARERYLDLLRALGVAEKGRQLAAGWVSEQPEDADAHYLQGRSFDDPERAMRAFEAALRFEPDHARAHMGVAAVARGRGQPQEAVDGYRRALELDDGLIEAWRGLVYALLESGRAPEALEAAQQAKKAVPDEPEGYLLTALLAPEQASQVLAQAEQAVPGDPRVPVARAELRLGAGDGAGAAEAAGRALAVDPHHPEALRARMFGTAMKRGHLDVEGWEGLLEQQRGEHEDPAASRTAADRLVERYPQTALTWMSRARVRARTGDRDGAGADLRKALELEPDNLEAQAAYGLLLKDQGKAEAARPLVEAAQAERPRDVSLALASAELAVATGDLDEGQRRFRAAAERWPHDMRVHLMWAKALSEAGQAEGAYAVLHRAVQQRPDQRLVLALAAAARDTGRLREAAGLLDDLGRQTGEQAFRDLSRRLRAQAAEAE